MRILIACEYSGRVRDSFIAKGHDAISCDFLPTEQPGPHYQGNVIDILNKDWDMMVAFPPCTFICKANAPHYNRARFGNTQVNARRIEQQRAIRFFACLQFGASHIPKIAIENPIPLKCLTDVVGKYTQIIQPYEHGNSASKSTCLWLKSLPELKPTKVVDRGKMVKCPNGTNPEWSHHLPIKDRAKTRSLTFQGIADAMAEQWGNIQMKERKY